MEQIEWKNYRHSDFLISLNLSNSDLKLVRLFCNRKSRELNSLNEHLNTQPYLKEKVEANG